MKHKIFFILSLCLVLSVSAQNRFITLNWQELPAARTLPKIVETIPLPNDFSSYQYKAIIEFPEFMNLDPQTVAELKSKNTLLPALPEVESTIAVSVHQGVLSASFIPVVYREGTYQRINSFKLLLVRTPVTTRSAVQTRQVTTSNSVLSLGKLVKIRVSDSGVYRISYSELRKMGFANPDKVRLYGYGGYLLSQQFSEHPADDLPQVPMYRAGDAVLFYARGTVNWVSYGNAGFTRIRNFYSDYGYYFLTESEETPVEFPIEASESDEGTSIETFNAYALYEKDAYSWANTGRELYDGYDYALGNSQSYSFKLPDITDENGQAEIIFAASSKGANSSLSVAIGGQNRSTTTINAVSGNIYGKAMEASIQFDWLGDKSENTTVTLTHNRNAGSSGRLNYIALNYKQKLHLRGSYLAFRSTESKNKKSTFVLTGATPSTVVWDVTSPTNYKLIVGKLSGSTYLFTIPASATQREFVAVNTLAAFNEVEVVGGVANQNLHALSGIDMVIISADRVAMLQQAERLAQVHREKDKLTVAVVTATQVYNEFSSGTPDATAYRRLMKMLYARSTSEKDSPKYLLLFGDCAYDNRMISSVWKGTKTSDFLLSYQDDKMVDESAGFMTDDYFGFLGDSEGVRLERDALDIGIGRFPVRTPDEARIAVDKTIAYMENKNAGAWKRNIGFFADDSDDSFRDGRFMAQSEILIKSLQENNPLFKAERVYQDAYKRETSATGSTYTQARKRLAQLFDQGMLIANYVGHSGTTGWADEKLLTADDVVKMSSPRLPFWFTASCDFTRIDDYATSAGELAFLNPTGGAIALYSTSRVVYDDPNAKLNQAMFSYLFAQPNGQRLRLGDVTRLAKVKTGDNRNKLNFVLVGDPALTLAYPDYKIEIDQFNGSTASELPFMKAGSKTTVKGHILTPDGKPADDFTGIIHPLVLDSKESVTTLNNSGYGGITYTDHNKTLFSGADSVRNGRFELILPVPLDINYSDEQGRLHLYAIAADRREAGGMYNNFLVGGTADDIASDSSGPKMFLYLNTPDFVWGGQVNETPYLVVELEDEDGINTVGNGIGHDLSLCIDGKTTYSLNDYYTPMAASYTKGRVAYSIPALSEGKHTLTFRAWDIMNNSSVKELEFEVVKGLRPGLFSMTCSKSPAREGTTFILSHDRAGSQVNVRMSVCDFAGRELWVHTENGVSFDNYYYIDWDLCSNAGQRLWPGVYLYRATITSEGAQSTTKTEKIVILAQ